MSTPTETGLDRAAEIFERAAELNGEARSAYLEGACADDASLRGEIDSMLRAHDEQGDFLGSPSQDVARDVTAAAHPTEKPGQTIGRYKLLECIGEGGFGTVWAAEQKEPVRRRVALKIIKLGMDTKQVIARFEAERQALALMDHPNIARVLDAGSTDTGRPFFVMELVKGVPVLEYCDTEKLDTKARLDLFIKVCHAIQHAHQKGIIHRDIKPSNVLITLHDGVPVPKVIDFGIAKATNAELTEKTIYTQHRQMIGTPAYMSPEQAEMSGLDIDTRSDVYSLGVLLYELLTGTTPFENADLLAKGYAEMMRIIREDEPHKPSTRLSTLGDMATRTAQQRRVEVNKLGSILRGDLDWIVMKCLEKDRSRRYETANGLAADIRRHLDDEPVTAGPPSTGYRFRKFVKRNRGQVIGATAVAAMLVLGVIGTSFGMAWALNEKGRADTELARATEIKRLITDMLEGVDPYTAEAADKTLLLGILDDAAARLVSNEITDQVNAAELHDLIGVIYQRLGMFQRAERHTPEAVRIRREVLGEEHPETLRCMRNLAQLLESLGRYDEAEELFDHLVRTHERIGGSDHRDTLHCGALLADVIMRQGRYAAAKERLLPLVEATKRVLGDDDPVTIVAMGTLAGVHGEMGQYEEYVGITKALYERRMQRYGANDPATLRAMTNLGVSYSRQGRYDEAESVLTESLRRKKEVLGEEHISTLRCMNNLAELYRNQGRIAEAESLFVRTIDIEKRVLGEAHPGIELPMASLAEIYSATGRHAEAEELWRHALAVSTDNWGEEHPNTLRTKAGLANHARRQSQYAEAESLYLEVLDQMRRILGAEHPTTLHTLFGLAELYRIQRQFDKAEPVYRELSEGAKRTCGPVHPDTLEWTNLLAIAYREQRKFAEAEPLFREVFERRTEAFGAEHVNTLRSTVSLGLLFNAMERYDEAVRIIEANLPSIRRTFGAWHVATTTATQGLSEAYAALGREDDVLQPWRDLFAVAVAAAADPAADPRTLNEIAYRLLTQTESLHDSVNAVEIARRACDSVEAASGENLWMYLDTLALAQHMNGDSATALETQKRALELIPENAAAGAVAEMREHLKTFEAAVAQRPDASKEERDQ